MITEKQIRKFAKIRNAGSLPSNLQFNFDLGQAGIEVNDLPNPVKLEDGSGYEWHLPIGVMREKYGLIEFDPK